MKLFGSGCMKLIDKHLFRKQEQRQKNALCTFYCSIHRVFKSNHKLTLDNVHSFSLQPLPFKHMNFLVHNTDLMATLYQLDNTSAGAVICDKLL